MKEGFDDFNAKIQEFNLFEKKSQSPTRGKETFKFQETKKVLTF